MKALLKFIFKLVVILLIIWVIGAVCLMLFVNPNRFKGRVALNFEQMTGRKILFEGNMSWKFYPFLGLKSKHIIILNPDSYKQKIFAEISTFSTNIRLLPLLHKRIEPTSVVIDGLKLNLDTNLEGKTNWNFVPQQNVAPKASMNNTFVSIAFADVYIKNSNINWLDERSNISFNLANFNLTAKKLNRNNLIPLKISTDITSNNFQGKSHLQLDTQVEVDASKRVFTIKNLTINSDVTQNQHTMKMAQTGDFVIDLNRNTLESTSFKEQIGSVSLSGKINITNLHTNPTLNGHLDISPFDLKKLLQDLGRDNANLQLAKNVSGKMDFVADEQGTKVTGMLLSPELQLFNLHFTNLSSTVLLQNGIWNLPDLTADFYQGKLKTALNIKLITAMPEFVMQTELMNVNTAVLLKELSIRQNKVNLAGTANVSMSLTGVGLDEQMILQHLNGNGKFSIAQGAVIGLDVNYLIGSAKAVIKNAPAATNTNQTPFGDLTGTFTVVNGIFTNNDLLVDAPGFVAKGKGVIDLRNQQLRCDMQLALRSLSPDYTIPLIISGTLERPLVTLDPNAIASALVQKNLPKAKAPLKNVIEKHVGGKAGAIISNWFGN